MGQPVPFNSGSSCSEYIAAWSDTQGSETSQYLEEKKANAIPLVAASETGSAQSCRVTKCVRSRIGWEAWP